MPPTGIGFILANPGLRSARSCFFASVILAGIAGLAIKLPHSGYLSLNRNPFEMKIRMKKNKPENMEEKDEKDMEEVAREDREEVDAPESETAEEPEKEEEGEEAGEGTEELKELRNKYLRLVAEFDNYRKRVARERIELIQTSEKDVVVSLLDILDDADRAEEQMAKTENIEVVKEGALLIFDKLRKVLKSRGLKEMETLHGDYDAELQEAIAEVPAPSEELKGKVIDNIQKGYYLNDKIIRHAKVVVGK